MARFFLHSTTQSVQISLVQMGLNQLWRSILFFSSIFYGIYMKLSSSIDQIARKIAKVKRNNNFYSELILPPVNNVESDWLSKGGILKRNSVLRCQIIHLLWKESMFVNTYLCMYIHCTYLHLYFISDSESPSVTRQIHACN